MATKRKTTRRRKTTSKPRKRTRRRLKKDQRELLRNSIAVVFMVFGFSSLLFLGAGKESDFSGFRDSLFVFFGNASYFIPIWSFVIFSLLVFPGKTKVRVKKGILSTVILLLIMGVFEIPILMQKAGEFQSENTYGGVIGYAFSSLFSSILPPLIAGIIELSVLVFLILYLTNIPISELFKYIVSGWRSFSKAYQAFADVVSKALYERFTKEVSSDETQSSSKKSKEAPIITHTMESLRKDPNESRKVNDYRAHQREINNSIKTHEGETKKRFPSVWFLPPIDLLEASNDDEADFGDPEKRSEVIEKTLESFGVSVRVVEVNIGPTITQYAIEPAVGVKVSKIVNLQNDLALALATSQLRIEAPIPGKSYIGIEVPNYSSATVTLRGVLDSNDYKQQRYSIPIALGRNVSGEVYSADLSDMPHLLVAGATGSGKSVCINSIISTFLYSFSPDVLKMILVDPKVVELSRFNGIPHLLSEVITQPKQTLSALKWAIDEMETRYRVFAKHGVRDILSYNKKNPDSKYPFIVIVIDELSDLMMASASEVEGSIVRLAQKARATGIHLIIATQRPSVNVVTGLIKANVPARVCFAVASQMDSRVVLDQNGAEKLLGKGDMLYSAPDISKSIRLQGVFVSDPEVESIVKFWSRQGTPDYIEEVVTQKVVMKNDTIGSDDDELLEEAFMELQREGRASASLLQRRLRIGYSRAARIIDILEAKGVIGPRDGSKPREILKSSLE